MARTKKGQWSRSCHLKRDKERGLQRIQDAAQHNKHKNLNINADQISYVKFNCKMKSSFHGGFSPGHLKGVLGYTTYDQYQYYQDYDWKQESLDDYYRRKIEESNKNGWVEKIYCDLLKQLQRRGKLQRFLTHNRRSKIMDQLI